MRVNVKHNINNKVFKVVNTDKPEIFMSLDYVKLSGDLLRVQKKWVEFSGDEPTLVLGVIK